LRSQVYTGCVGAENFPYFVAHPPEPRWLKDCSDTMREIASRRHQITATAIGKADVEIVNSLQVQNAEKCLYFH
jgi:hypothetical protein